MNTPLRGSVQFRIADIIHPSPVFVLRQLFENNVLEGEVIAVTHDGSEPDNFLVLNVPGVSEPVIVPELKTSNYLSAITRRERICTENTEVGI